MEKTVRVLGPMGTTVVGGENMEITKTKIKTGFGWIEYHCFPEILQQTPSDCPPELPGNSNLVAILVERHNSRNPVSERHIVYLPG